MNRILAAGLLIVLPALSACQDLLTNPAIGTEPVATTAGLIVHNQASVSVWYMYISPCASSTWGNDQLGSSETIAPGMTRRWTLQPGCYDVRAEFSDYSYAEDRLDLRAGVDFTWRLLD